MIVRALVIVVAGLLVAADAKEDVAKEMKKLEGKWKVVAVEARGMKVPEDKLKGAAVIIKGDKITMADPGKAAKELVFKIDPTKKPKHIDLTDPKEKDTAPAIYSLDGDELKICVPLAMKDAKRPETFDTKDKPQMAFTCRRAK